MESIALAPPSFAVVASRAATPSSVFSFPPKARGAIAPLLLAPGARWKVLCGTPTLPQGVLGNEEHSANKISDEATTTVHVKFMLRKECRFGEQFFLVGDVAALGMWNPSRAVPLQWSDGHLWIAELDLPIGSSIQFKFILRDISGEINWQSGPDRVLQTWKTMKTVVISEDWDAAEKRKITEEQQNSGIAKVHNHLGEDGIIFSREDQKSAMTSSSLEEGCLYKEPDDYGIVPDSPLLEHGLAPTPKPDSSGTLSSSKLLDNTDTHKQEERIKPSEVDQQETGIRSLAKEPCTEEHNESTATRDVNQRESQHEESTAICSNQNVEDGPMPVQDRVRKDIQWGQAILRKCFQNLGLFEQGST